MSDDLSRKARGFASALPASVELPAGAGKTHLLAATVCELLAGGGRVLILTHTNAGVQVIRKRLKDFGAGSSYTVATITSFAFALVRPYPSLANLEVPPVPVWADSTTYIEAANRVSSAKQIQRVLHASFTHLLVDEYQDCSLIQHDFVCTLAESIPRTGVLGDRMQAIFGFSDPLIPWTAVQARFPAYDVPTRPQRWQGHNEPLGEWLLELREKLVPGVVVDFSSARLPHRVTFAQFTRDTRTQKLKAIGKRSWPANETVLVITGAGPNQTRSAAADLGGRFSAMEEIRGGFMHEMLTELATCDPAAYASWLAKASKGCFCGHSGLNRPLINRLDKGMPVSGLIRTDLDQALQALDAVRKQQSLASIAISMDNIRRAPALKLHSHEAWYDMQTAIRGAVVTGGGPSVLTEELRKARDRIRHSGRAERRRVVSRTLLVKGLEYDHVIIANIGDVADAYNLYVALSRARKSITILGLTDQLIVKKTALEPKQKLPKK